MSALRKPFALALLVALGGCVSSGVAVKNDGTVYVTRGDKVFACTPAGDRLDCRQAATVK